MSFNVFWHNAGLM